MKFNPLDRSDEKTDGQHKIIISLPKALATYQSDRPQTKSHTKYPSPWHFGFGAELFFIFLLGDLFWSHWHDFQYSLYMTTRFHKPIIITVGLTAFDIDF